MNTGGRIVLLKTDALALGVSVRVETDCIGTVMTSDCDCVRISTLAVIPGLKGFLSPASTSFLYESATPDFYLLALHLRLPLSRLCRPYDGSNAAEVQSEPDYTAKSFMAIIKPSPSTYLKLMFATCGKR